MRRGVVFLACHNAVAELADKLIKKNVNPDKLSLNPGGRADQSSDSGDCPYSRRCRHSPVNAASGLPLRQIVFSYRLFHGETDAVHCSPFSVRLSACTLLALPALAEEQTGKAPPPLCKHPPRFNEHTLPPWQGETNNDAIDRGLLFTIPEIDVLADFHGDLTDPKLVLFFGGNYFFATKFLVSAFEATHPDSRAASLGDDDRGRLIRTD